MTRFTQLLESEFVLPNYEQGGEPNGAQFATREAFTAVDQRDLVGPPAEGSRFAVGGAGAGAGAGAAKALVNGVSR